MVINLKKKRSDIFYKIGKIFLILNIIKFVFLYLPIKPIYMIESFWYCNFTSFLLSLVLMYGNKIWIKKIATLVLTTAIVAQSMWIIFFVLDFFNIYHAGRIIGMGFNMINPPYVRYIVYSLSIMEHILLIPISFYVVKKLGFDKNSFWFIQIFLFCFLTFSFLISTNGINLNCIRHSCDLVTEDIYNYGLNLKTFIYYLYQLVEWFLLISVSFIFFSFILKKDKNNQ